MLEILDVPDAPTAPVPGNAVRDQEVLLSRRAPEANGAPVDRYRLKGTGGVSQECGSTACEVTGLTNGQDYRFQVQAHNAVGWSDWSPQSAVATPDAKPGRVGPIELVREGDRTLTIRWTPPTTQTSAIHKYYVSYPGGSPKTTSKPSITITGLDNNTQYTFTVAAENDFDIGESRTSSPFQSVGPPGIPAAPLITDKKTPGDTGAVTLTWPAVDPNGPTPVRYTVLRNGAPLPACTGITVTQCDNSGMAYDGTVYQYAVSATNKNGEGRTTAGPAASWSAVGVPAPWGSWTVGPTGQNAEGTASFEVPASRGGTSKVRVFVNGDSAKEIDARGPQTLTFGVPTNDRSYSVQLEVCNEAGLRALDRPGRPDLRPAHQRARDLGEAERRQHPGQLDGHRRRQRRPGHGAGAQRRARPELHGQRRRRQHLHHQHRRPRLLHHRERHRHHLRHQPQPRHRHPHRAR